MPIDLTNLKQAAQSNSQTYTPKWFHAELTGSGGKVGLLNNSVTVWSKKNANIPLEWTNGCKKTWSQGNISYRRIPLNMYNVILIDKFPELPKHGDTFDVSSAQDGSIEIAVEPSGLCISKNETLKEKSLDVAYNVRVYITEDPFCPTYHYCQYVIPSRTRIKNYVIAKNTNDILSTVINYCKNEKNFDQSKLIDWMKKTTLYSLICRMAEKWNTSLHEEIGGLIDILAQNSRINVDKEISRWFSDIEQYPVPLSVYQKMYSKLQASGIDASLKKRICCANLNMLMHEKMHELGKNKSKLSFVAKTKKPTPAIAPYSQEQQAAILSEAPLTLIQAGAGCGKSSTLLGRMEHMFHEGVDAKKTLVLTFTNAAADNITAKQPLVKSSTIASLIHDIYSANFPDHKLSNIETIINSLSIYFDPLADPVVKKLQTCLQKFRETNIGQSVFTETNLFLLENFDSVMTILNKLKQTCLELEIMVMYQMVDTFVEPAGLDPEHIIMDEVQDTSIFEFVFILSYALRKRASVYLVGDASQTLYEFRYSNPKALNVLETSGIFDIYALTTNYRSNQAILDFANVALKDIEANTQAQIQLKANSFAVGMPFEKKVQFFYHKQQKRLNILSDLHDLMVTSINYWATPMVEAGEQVAFIAHSRRAVGEIETCLKNIFPGKTINNLVPEKPYTNTLFSKYIMKFWDESRFFNTDTFMQDFQAAILKHITQLTWNVRASQKAAANLIEDVNTIEREYKNSLTTMRSSLRSSTITKTEFLDMMKQLLLDYEIKKNTAKFHIIQNRNSETKKHKDGDLVVSTIHSVKGLEFPHVCVVYTAGNDPDEADKRMYYVAFTRAIKSILIAAFDTERFSALELKYNSLVSQLKGNPIYKSDNDNSNNAEIAEAS